MAVKLHVSLDAKVSTRPRVAKASMRTKLLSAIHVQMMDVWHSLVPSFVVASRRGKSFAVDVLYCSPGREVQAERKGFDQSASCVPQILFRRRLF